MAEVTIIGTDSSDQSSDTILTVTNVIVPAGGVVLVAYNEVWEGTAGLPPPPHTIAVTYGETPMTQLYLSGVPDPSAPAESFQLWYYDASGGNEASVVVTLGGGVPDSKNIIVIVLDQYTLAPEESYPPSNSGGVTDAIDMEFVTPTILPAVLLAFGHHCGPVTDAAGTWTDMTVGSRIGTSRFDSEYDTTLDFAYRFVAAAGTELVHKEGFDTRAVIYTGVFYSKRPNTPVTMTTYSYGLLPGDSANPEDIPPLSAEDMAHANYRQRRRGPGF